MWWGLLALAAAAKTGGAAGPEGPGPPEEGGVCLLQGGLFLERQQQLSGELQVDGGAVEPHGPVLPCPGEPVRAAADSGKCWSRACPCLDEGALAVAELFDDNVALRGVRVLLNGGEIDVLAHAFPVGRTAVVLEGSDIAGNTRRCTRDVHVADHEPPRWLAEAGGLGDAALALALDESCFARAPDAFLAYEELGWSAAAADNCGVRSVQRQVRQDDRVVYDEHAGGLPVLRGPSVAGYELLYVATDVHGLTATHTAALSLEDRDPPTAIFCPEPVFVEVPAGAREGTATWEAPRVTADNCLGFGELPPARDASGLASPHPENATLHVATLPVGQHRATYPLADASGNAYEEECVVEITIRPRAPEVLVTCPEPEPVDTLPDAAFGVPCWEPPNATQGGKPLPAHFVTTRLGVAPGMPFLYGQTTVHVVARGEVTGQRTREANQTDECTFTVQVRDPQRPDVDGRVHRCDRARPGYHAGLVEPYAVCDGADLGVRLHEGYESSGWYELTGVERPAARECCHDEAGTEFACAAQGSPLFKYCVPLGAVPPAPVLCPA